MFYFLKPTSGLDSTASLEIIGSLKEIAQLGMNVSMVIHQPRYSLFTLIDDVLLLGVGGRTVFLGPTNQAQTYFEKLGFKCPPAENPADFFLDIISGQISLPDNPSFEVGHLPVLWNKVQRVPEYLSDDSIPTGDGFGDEAKEEWDSIPLKKSFDVEDLSSLLHNNPAAAENYFEGARSRASSSLNSLLPSHVQHVRRIFEELDVDGDGVLQRNELIDLVKSFNKSMTTDEISKYLNRLEVVKDEGTSFEDFMNLLRKNNHADNSVEKWKASQELQEDFAQLLPSRRRPVNFGRQLQYFLRRECSKLLGNWKRVMFDILLLALFGAFIGIVFSSNYDESSFAMISQMTILAVGLLSCTSSLRWFGAERLNYWREQSAGTSRLAYIVAKVLMQSVEVLFYPLVFAIVFFGTIYPRGVFLDVYEVLFMIYFVGSGMGMVFSTIAEPQNALLLAVLVPLSLGGFVSGTNPRYNEMSAFGHAFASLSFVRWGLEAFLIIEYNYMESYLQEILDEYLFYQGFSHSNFDTDLMALIILGVSFRLLLYPALTFVNRAKQI
eukprot:TRINITY_DN13004_c0_g1_i1.p1 TRINITY_DN13004_c0_g1~~TRINITY_DN13004_c0_g1_i1.p1  ORF type:complete len:553 (+),score=127.25 TRINITY_DN13004_c0_g1_i1:445-2103(+)